MTTNSVEDQKEKPAVPHVLSNPNVPTPIKAFTDEGDELAGVSREELLAELGKTGEVEEGKARIIEDVITGQRLRGISPEEESELDALAQLSPETLKRQLSQVAKQNIMYLMPSSITDAEAEEIVKGLEEKLSTISYAEIKRFTADEVRAYIGDVVYDGIRKFNNKPNSIAKRFLLELKDSMVQSANLINSLKEVEMALKFFGKEGIEQLHNEIQAQVNESEEKPATELERYLIYLGLYIERLKTFDDHETNSFVLTEIRTSEEKISAVKEALTFDRILKKAESMKEKIVKDFKNADVVTRVISDFVGKMNNDPTILVTFPVPKSAGKELNDAKTLAGIWVAFMEMIIIQKDFPDTRVLTPMEYGDIVLLVTGSKKADGDERLEMLKKFADETGITPEVIELARRIALVFSFIMAKTFKPTQLNDTHTKYVLSYTMNILAQSMTEGYREMTYKLIHDIVTILSTP